MSFIDLATSFLGGGGLTAAVTGAIGAFTKYKELKLSYEHKKDQWAFEVQMYQAQSQQERYLVEKKALMVTETVNAATLQAAINSDSREVVELLKRKGKAPLWAIFRILFRPMLTLALFFACVFMPFMPMPEVSDTYVANPDISGIYTTIRQGFSATLGFWFGSRAVSGPDDNSPYRAG